MCRASFIWTPWTQWAQSFAAVLVVILAAMLAAMLVVKPASEVLGLCTRTCRVLHTPHPQDPPGLKCSSSPASASAGTGAATTCKGVITHTFSQRRQSLLQCELAFDSQSLWRYGGATRHTLLLRSSFFHLLLLSPSTLYSQGLILPPPLQPLVGEGVL